MIQYKTKRTWPNYLIGVCVILACIAAYLWGYFFPTIESINVMKRETVDYKRKIEDFAQAESDFQFPDEKEKKYFANLEQQIQQKIPGIRGKGDLKKAYLNISTYLQELAQRDGVQQLKIDSNIQEAGTTLQKTMKSRGMTLTFRSILKNGLHFINHIPRGKYLLNIDRLVLSPGNSAPGFIAKNKEENINFNVDLRFYYFPGKGKTKTHFQTISDPSAKESELEIDTDSGVLLQRVYDILPAMLPVKIKNLPAFFGVLF